jgi:hypothetical protein
MMSGLYEALIAAGSGDGPARRAAEEAAAYENRLSKIDSELNLLKWMAGFNIALTAAVLAKLLV